MNLRLLSLLVTTLALSSCTTMDQGVADTAAGDASGAPKQVGVTVGGAPASDPMDLGEGPSGLVPNQSATEPEDFPESQPTIYRGNDQVVRMPAARPPVKFFGEAVSLNFEEAPLTEVIHAVMGDILELDYIVEHPIEGNVTVRTRSPVPRDELLGILESLLQANKAYIILDKDGRYFISSSDQMSKLNPGVSAATESVVGYSTIIVPLQFISASNMADILSPVADEAAFVRVDPTRNLLMLAGTAAQLDGWQEIIATFDVDLLKGMSVGIFPIENASIEDIEDALSGMLGKEGAEGVEGATGIGTMVKIIPVERLNSIMVVTPRAHYLERVETWIERLDRAPNANFERRLYVYPVQNTNAVHLADMLSTIFAGSSGGSSGGRKGGVAPGLTPETVSSGGASGGSTSRSRSGGTGSETRNFSVGDIRVVADEENNSLLIYATGKEYRKIQSALERLDIAPTQVVIEASIIEVTLEDNLRYGLEWSFNGSLGGDYTGVGQLIQGENATIGPDIPGFAYSVINGSGNIKAVLNALASDNLLNVISSPSVMVLDNQTASIRVGNDVPIESGETLTDGGNSITTIEYRDTGVQLDVTPSVNAGGMVTMDIEQSVVDIGPVDAEGAGQRTFLERKITSKVAVRSSESVVLGGLIRENKSAGSSGIPILHNLPIIGPLFGAKASEDIRTELLVMITPRVIYSDSDLRDVSREMRSQMRSLELIDGSGSFFPHSPVDGVAPSGSKPVTTQNTPE